MAAFVVDTNVAIIANGRGTHADARCRLICVERLRSLAAREVVALDDGGSILEEYKRRLNFSGMPGVGDAFLKHVFNYQYQEDRVRRVAVTPSEDDGGVLRSYQRTGSTVRTESSWQSRSSQRRSF